MFIALVAVLAGCGAAASTPPPTPTPVAVVPTPTPDRHIGGAVDANRVFQILASAGLPVHQESLGGPGPKGEPNLTLFVVAGAIPIAISQYGSPKAVAAAGYRAGSAVAKGDAPFELWSSNVVVHLGERIPGRIPATPGADLVTTAQTVVAVLDPYLGPLAQRAVAPVALPAGPAAASPSAVAPSAPPKAKPKPTPKPTKKP